MFERLPATQVSHLAPRDTVLAVFSFLIHASAAGTILIACWLALPDISLPRLRPVLVTPVFLMPAGASAPKLGSRNPSATPAVAKAPISPPPEKIVPPREIPPLPEEKAEAERQDEKIGTGDGADIGDPRGAPDGDSRGIPGGVCVGDDCDPNGPVGFGPGIKGAPAPDEPPEIQRPGFLDVTEPVLVESSKILPVYPELARRAGVTGQVILEAIIRTDGSVASLTILREAPSGVGFAEAARQAVSRWRYRPALQHGVPVAVYFTVTIEFTLSR
jgi:TonB family protein